MRIRDRLIKKSFDVVLSIAALLILSPLLLFIAILIKLETNGPILYWSDRVGIGSTIFRMPKFRTMRQGTPVVATHLLINTDSYVTTVGQFLRKTSLDELPQLWSIFVGDMSFVGPRPALFNQDDLIILRRESGVDRFPPGLTGWAQVNGRDELAIVEKVKYEVEYLERQSFRFDLKIMVLTFFKVVGQNNISH